MEGQGLTFDSLRSALEKLDRFRVHVVGDTIVDSHTQTAMIGGHTKTPTMSVLYERRDDYIGGAPKIPPQLPPPGGPGVVLTGPRHNAPKKLVFLGRKEQGPKC